MPRRPTPKNHTSKAVFGLGLAPGLVQAGPILLGLPLGAWTAISLVVAGLLWTVWPRR